MAESSIVYYKFEGIKNTWYWNTNSWFHTVSLSSSCLFHDSSFLSLAFQLQVFLFSLSLCFFLTIFKLFYVLCAKEPCKFQLLEGIFFLVLFYLLEFGDAATLNNYRENFGVCNDKFTQLKFWIFICIAWLTVSRSWI